MNLSRIHRRRRDCESGGGRPIVAREQEWCKSRQVGANPRRLRDIVPQWLPASVVASIFSFDMAGGQYYVRQVAATDELMGARADDGRRGWSSGRFCNVYFKEGRIVSKTLSPIGVPVQHPTRGR